MDPLILKQKRFAEKVKTKECLTDVMQFLSHDTSTTRRELVRVLQGHINLLEAEINRDPDEEFNERLVGANAIYQELMKKNKEDESEFERLPRCPHDILY